MYFYRRGRGRYQAAPPETLKVALAGLEKRKRIQERIAVWGEALARFECPQEIAALRDELLDWREAAHKYEGARMVIRDGGDHTLASFPEHIPRILAFAGLAPRA